MAKSLNEQQTSFFNLPLSIQRLNPRPLDPTSVWNNYNDAEEYAKNGATSHVGQTISVITEVNGKTTADLYIIADEEGTLKGVGGLETDSEGNVLISDLHVTDKAIFDSGITFRHEDNEAEITYNDNGLLVDTNLCINGALSSLFGFELGIDGEKLVGSYKLEKDGTISKYVHFLSDIELDNNKGIMIENKYIIKVEDMQYVSLSAPGMIMKFGDNTEKIALLSDIYNDNGDMKIITRYGDGSFLNSFEAGNGRSGVLISTYKNNNDDSGVLISKNLKFGTTNGVSVHGDQSSITFDIPFDYNDSDSGSTTQKDRYILLKCYFQESNSAYALLNQDQSDLIVSSEADFVVFDKPIESKTSIGISESKTRILNDQLFFSENANLVALQDGIKYYGNAYFNGNIGSVSFSSGFAGRGWRIEKNGLTGNIAGTFDELTVRKKMRIYELEVQAIHVTNGSLWVSDSCSGDNVEELV